AGRSHPHVAKVRKKLEQAGDVETVTTSIDTKGRKQPAIKPQLVKLDIQQEHRPPRQLTAHEQREMFERMAERAIEDCIRDVQGRVQAAIGQLSDADDRSLLFEKLRAALDAMHDRERASGNQVGDDTPPPTGADEMPPLPPTATGGRHHD